MRGEIHLEVGDDESREEVGIREGVVVGLFRERLRGECLHGVCNEIPERLC